MILLTNLMSSPLSFVRWHPVSKEKVSLNCSQIKLVASYKMIHIYLGNIFSVDWNDRLLQSIKEISKKNSPAEANLDRHRIFGGCKC